AAGGRREVLNPYDASVVTTVDEADATDVDRAVRAARRAFVEEDWANAPTRQRADLLMRVHDLLLRDRDEIARTETLDTGKTLTEGRIDVEDVANAFRYFAELAGKDGGRVVDVGPDVLSRVVYQPVGGCALLAPGDDPLLQAGRHGARPPAQLGAAAPHHRHDPADLGAGWPARSRQPGPRFRGDGRRGSDLAPRGRPGVVHRGSRHRTRHHGRCRRGAEEHRARAGRQE